MSMPLLDEFNFNDINLDFLESPPHSTLAVEPTAKAQHLAVPPFLSPEKFFSSEAQEYNPTQHQLQNSKPYNSIVEISRRIAEADTLICQIRRTEKERDELRKQLGEFHQSAKEVQSLYALEKQKRIEEKAKKDELFRRCQGLDTNLTAKTLEVDQLQAKLDSLKGPIEYKELAVRYLKLVQRFDEQIHWQEHAVVKDLHKYCKEKCLKIPPITQRSPRKRKASAVKVDMGIQCDIELNKASENREFRNQATKFEKISTRNQGCQHIGTTTTRSTTTACFFKYHDVGVNCNLLDFKYALSEMLNDMRSWSTHVSPLSPIGDLDANTDESMCVDISPIQLSPLSSNCTKSKVSLPPPLPNPLPRVELKTVGTCTLLCNVQRHIDYNAHLPFIKRSSSRPPSRVMVDTVKDENMTQSTATTPSVLDPLNTQVPSITHLFPSAFDELWQIFGHMLYGLLHRRNGNIAPFSNQTVATGNITNQQEFYNWLQTLYLDIHSEERTQQIPNPDPPGTSRIESSTTVDSNREGSDHQARNCNVESPLIFSNVAPVKCTSSAQYLFKPKAQRSGNNHVIDEVSMTDSSERHSRGTSPIRCIISSPICSEINVIKENSMDNPPKKNNDCSFEYSVENRTPSAFTSPKSTTSSDTAKSEYPFKISKTAKKILELFPSVNNSSTTLESLEKLLHQSWKNSRKKRVDKCKSKRLSKSYVNVENETAVDFISKLNIFTNKPDAEINENERPLETFKLQTDQSQRYCLLNKKKRTVLNRKKHEIQIHQLFGSDTDSNDEEMKCNLSSKSDNGKENNEQRQQEKLFQMDGFFHSSSNESMELNQFNSTRQEDTESRNEEKTCNRDNVVKCCKKPQSEQQKKFNVLSTKEKEIYDQQILFCDRTSEKTKQTNFDIQKEADSMKNDQVVLQYRPMSSENVRSISSRNDIDLASMFNIEKESKEHQSESERIYKFKEPNIKDPSKDSSKLSNADTKNSSIEEQVYAKEFFIPANKVETAKSPDESCISVSPIPYTNEELKQNEELFQSPKEFSSKIVENLSPLSDSSTSSTESKLVIDSDNEEMKDLESMLLIPKRRGRKRKSESSASSLTDLIVTNSTVIPCKRSARLIEKRKVSEEQKITQQSLQLLTLGKYTKPNNKKVLESKIEQRNMKEEHAIKVECSTIPVPILGYFREYNTEENIENGKTKDLSNEKKEELEYDNQRMKNIKTTIPKNNYNESTTNAFAEDSIKLTTLLDCANFLTKNVESRPLDISIPQNLSFSSPPASPTPLDSESIDEKPIKEIPLERSGENFLFKRQKKSLLHNLIRNYGTHQYRSFISNELKEDEKTEVCQLEIHFKEYLALSVPSEDAAVQLVSLVLSTSQNLKIIAHALCLSIREDARPATIPYEHLRSAEVPMLNRSNQNNIHQKMTNVISELIQRKPEITHTLQIVIESILFSVNDADTLSINAALNLTDLYLLGLTLQPIQLTENPARLFVAKCLYYYKVKAIPMIYAVLCVFPTTLPHREERNYDRSDALITVIQHTLMCTIYDMENHELFHREMLSKLRFAYHYEIFKPDFQDVLQNLLEKLRNGKLNNLKYAFAIFCKRLQPDRVVRDIIQPHMIPLSNEYYSVLQHTTDYDVRTAALLDCFSIVIKPFPRDTANPIVAEINNYLNIFKRFLSIVERPIVQEAAVKAILRLQRFNNINCYNALSSFRPDYELQPLTRAVLRTFIHRKKLKFWKTMLNQSG